MEDLQIIALYENRKEEAVRETDRKYGRLLYAQAGNILPAPNSPTGSAIRSADDGSASKGVSPKRPSPLSS